MIDDTLKTRLKSISEITDEIGSGDNARIFTEYQKQGSPLPHIVLEVFGGVSNSHLGGITGIADTRVQITCFASTATAAGDLQDLVRRSLQGFRGAVGDDFINGITCDSFESGHDKPTTKGGNDYRYWAANDYNIVFTESAVQL